MTNDADTALTFSIKIAHTRDSEGAQGFGVCDRFGREIGASWACGTEEFAPRPEGYRGGFFVNVAPGSYFTLQTSAQRAGKRFGAWQSTRLFPTAEARDAALAAYLKDAVKRAAKREGK